MAKEKQLAAEVKELTKATPAVSQAFGALVKSVNDSGVLDHKTKELIALGIAIAVRCEGCLLFHVRALIKLGASRDEITGAIDVAVEMGGGPARVYGAHALGIYDAMMAA
ncbi:MAG: carboxymuconolactone decarboxylase family protein [Geminicoccaceae bacterium]|nr:MAG: carboxymuconolactone decarboxylase family protein [Geminicoccaceae bacterium]